MEKYMSELKFYLKIKASEIPSYIKFIEDY